MILESINVQQLLDEITEIRHKFVDSVEILRTAINHMGVQKKLSEWMPIKTELQKPESILEAVSCIYCGEEKEGSIVVCGRFLMEHKEFHHYNQYILDQANFFGDGDELGPNNSDIDDVEDE